MLVLCRIDRRFVGYGFIALCSACSAGGNGESPTAGDGSTSAGGAQSGGSGGVGAGGTAGTGGTAGSAGTGQGGASLLAACTTYLEAQCARREECGYDDAIGSGNCYGAIDYCPDYLFSTGSTRSVEQTLACAETWRTYSCDEILLGKIPSCATPGTRQAGETCAFASQCESMTCTSSIGTCGTCTALAEPGGACEFNTITCPDGQVCNGGICADALPRTPTLYTPVAAGDSCYVYDICPDGYACLDDVTGYDAHCAIPPAIGEPCRGTPDSIEGACAEGAYCAGGTICEPLPGPGEPCGLGSYGGDYCSKDAYCDAGDDMCHARGDVGDSCYPFRTILRQSTCLDGLTCFCVDAQCSAGGCYELRREGDTCGDSRGHCIPATECVDGRCVATDDVVIFAEACVQ